VFQWMDSRKVLRGRGLESSQAIVVNRDVVLVIVVLGPSCQISELRLTTVCIKGKEDFVNTWYIFCNIECHLHTDLLCD
jgi:hypothetical protein